MELLTFPQLKEDLGLLQTKLWTYIDGRYAFKHGYERHPFRGVLMDEVTDHDEHIARAKVYVRYWGETMEFVYMIGRRYTILVTPCANVDAFTLKGPPTHLSWDIRVPIVDWLDQLNTNGSKRRCHERTALLKEEIAAAAWAPKRVEGWLATGGPDVLDTL